MREGRGLSPCLQDSGAVYELTGDLDQALFAYEQARRHNQWSSHTLQAISSILRTREKYPEAMEYLKDVLKIEPANGDAWGNLGMFHFSMCSISQGGYAVLTDDL